MDKLRRHKRKKRVVRKLKPSHDDTWSRTAGIVPVVSDEPCMNSWSKLYDAVLAGNAPSAKGLTEQALAAGIEPMSLVNDFMSPAMSEAGRRFEEGQYFVPQLLLSARAMKTALALLRPLLAACNRPVMGRIVIGTVQGDLHDIGKNIVAAVLEGGGFEVIDLGAGVTPEGFVAAVHEKSPDIVGMSALLTTTMLMMKDSIEALQKAGVRQRVKVLVGGAPVTRSFAEEVGADEFGSSAAEALRTARRWLQIEPAEPKKSLAPGP